jgi:hypothetical protein
VQPPPSATNDQLPAATNTPAINASTQTPLPTYTHVSTQTPLPTYTQFPTQTALPTDTPRPEPTRPSPRPNGALWFEDDCSSINVGRALFGLDYMNLSISNGQCHIAANSNGNLLPVMYAYPPLDDLAIELELTIDGVNSKSEYGIIFQSDDELSDGLDYYYLFSIKPAEKEMAITLWKNVEWTNVYKQQMPEEPLLPGKPTHVRLEFVDQQIRVFLNGEFVFETLDDQITTPGIFGVAVASFSAPETLHYDNLKVYALAP